MEETRQQREQEQAAILQQFDVQREEQRKQEAAERAKRRYKAAREIIIDRIPCTQFLEPSGGNLYCCPICGSGHGEHKTGAARYNELEKRVTCFSEKCGKRHYDVFDIYQAVYKVDAMTALRDLGKMAGIDVYDNSLIDQPNANHTRTTSAAGMNVPDSKKPIKKEPEAAEMDYTEYYWNCNANFATGVYPEAISYLEARGISLETANSCNIGFDPASDPANAPGANWDEYKPHPTPRIIIPTGKGQYIGRSIDPNTPDQYKKMNTKGGKVGLFNKEALYTEGAQYVYITEGAFDALSVLEAGAAAVALNSAANSNLLLSALEERPTAATLVLCLDNDTAGENAEEKLILELQRRNISYIIGDITGEHKDPNEYLTHDRKGFIEAVQSVKKQSTKPENVSHYIDNLMSADIAKFKQEVKTGFHNLDELIGGLYSGLYVIAAISSLGKTTFSAQLADQIAAAGHDVLFFSMEQSRLEMVSKSIARKTFINNPKSAVSSLSIRRGYLPPQVLDAADEYKREVKDRISIIEGNFNCTVDFISSYVRSYIANNTNEKETRPIVFIDYLQVLQPGINAKIQGTRESIDENVIALKRLSRELDITVIVISSVNRANYLQPISFESLKESGGIEYTADVIWGLQFQCLNDEIFDKEKNTKQRRERINEAKAANPRKIELKSLKNRYGRATFSAYFDYFPANDYFTVCADNDLDFTPAGKKSKNRA